MARLIDQVQPIVPALAAYAQELPSGRRRRELSTVCRVLEQNDAAGAAAALAELPEYWIPLLSSAAASSDPARVLNGFLDESQAAAELRRQWWATFAYPLFVAGLALAVLVALSFMVIPAFREIFADFGMQLPAATELTLALSQAVTDGRRLVVVVAILALALVALNLRRMLPTGAGDWLAQRFSGRWGRATAIAQFARFSADLLEAGMRLPEALRLAAAASRRTGSQRTVLQLAGDLEAGREPTLRSARTPLTATILYALHAEMEGAARIRLLKEIAACYADRARANAFPGRTALWVRWRFACSASLSALWCYRCSCRW